MSKFNEKLIAIDKHVANKIRQARTARGLSREQFCKKIDVVNQQLQKYEKAQNRLTAGRLLLIANALNMKISEFFEGLQDDLRPISEQDRLTITVAKNFSQIQDPLTQIYISNLIKRLSEKL